MKTKHIIAFIFLVLFILYLSRSTSNLNPPPYDPNSECAKKMCPPNMGPACIPGDGSGAYLAPWPYWNTDNCSPLCYKPSDTPTCGNLMGKGAVPLKKKQ